jgi:ubiquinone/menaquinone biosynthesis C-methylase UbiE
MAQFPKSKYVPALRFHCLTPFYDAVISATGRERTIKSALIRQAHLAPGQQVLDLGTGTGTLALWVKQSQPEVEIRGVDGDEKILAIARNKASKAELPIQFDKALSSMLPYPSAHFDRVLSSMFFHHLAWHDKVLTVLEIYRVLKPGAEVHVADWGRPSNLFMRWLFFSVQLFDGFDNTQDHVSGRLVTLFKQNGFVDVAQLSQYNTIYGTIALYRATKSG